MDEYGASVLEQMTCDYGTHFEKEVMRVANKPNEEPKVVGAGVGGAIGGVVGAVLGGPIGAAIGAGISGWTGHQIESDMRKKK